MAQQALSPLQGCPPRGSDPYTNAVAVTPSDTADLTHASRGIFVGGAGTLACIMFDNPSGATPTVSFTVAANTFLPICVRRVMNTGTSATLIVALN